MTIERQRLIAHVLGRTPTTILAIDNGYDFEVAIVDDEWVFRFPRRAAVEEALELEIALLPALAPALPVEIPSFEYTSRNPLFVGYRLIRGRPLVDEDAEGVYAFLQALHAHDASELPLERHDWVEAYREQCVEFERLVFPSSTSTGGHRRNDSSARWKRSWTTSLYSSTPTSAPSTFSFATAASPV